MGKLSSDHDLSAYKFNTNRYKMLEELQTYIDEAAKSVLVDNLENCITLSE